MDEDVSFLPVCVKMYKTPLHSVILTLQSADCSCTLTFSPVWPRKYWGGLGGCATVPVLFNNTIAVLKMTGKV